MYRLEKKKKQVLMGIRPALLSLNVVEFLPPCQLEEKKEKRENSKKVKECQRHVVFPSGHPSKY